MREPSNDGGVSGVNPKQVHHGCGSNARFWPIALAGGLVACGPAAKVTILLIATKSDETLTRGVKVINSDIDQTDRITSGTIIALDPDIPPNRQRVRFAAEGPGTQWFPCPGRHVAQLVDMHGMVLDEIRQKVRGAAARHRFSCQLPP